MRWCIKTGAHLTMYQVPCICSSVNCGTANCSFMSQVRVSSGSDRVMLLLLSNVLYCMLYDKIGGSESQYLTCWQNCFATNTVNRKRTFYICLTLRTWQSICYLSTWCSPPCRCCRPSARGRSRSRGWWCIGRCRPGRPRRARGRRWSWSSLCLSGRRKSPVHTGSPCRPGQGSGSPLEDWNNTLNFETLTVSTDLSVIIK